ncbi:hypothetical protein M0R19_08670 [Candidatus Pacearchaeota archaeon]|jgi:hypothetical protein|nr:hypothetical protein [bacterium]MCK9597231.1 hypothetical protein [Candidatus Pacearchaeota archaeon]
MIQDFYRFHGKKSVLILKINFWKKNGSLEIAPAIDPNREMRPVERGTNTYDYKNSKYFSLSPTEAAKLLIDLNILEKDPTTRIDALYHDRSKSEKSTSNEITMLNVGKWTDPNGITKTTINISSKNENEGRLQYILHTPQDLLIFKAFLNAVLKDVVVFGLFNEFLKQERERDNSSGDRKPKNETPFAS